MSLATSSTIISSQPSSSSHMKSCCDSIASRLFHLSNIGTDRYRQNLELARCDRDIAYWINQYAWTFDPRQKESFIPFLLFPKQKEFLDWVWAQELTQTDGLAEKSRDSGLTWLCVYYAVHSWLFRHGVKVGFGSRKVDLVDRIGDMDSILEKARFTLRNLPKWMLPSKFEFGKHDGWCKIINPNHGSAITGDGGDNIGRGGRSTLYFLDEAAFIEHQQQVDAALSQTTRVRIDVSTPNGRTNSFAEKRFGGKVSVFTFHWSDDPRKGDEWYAKECSRLASNWVIAQELDINYEGSVSGEWPAEYFGDWIWFDQWPSTFQVTALALDPAQEKGEHEKGCYAAFAYVGIDPHNVVWIDADISKVWDAQQLVEKGFELCARHNPRGFGVETNGGQVFLARLFLSESETRRIMLPLHSILNHENKDVRIRSLGPLLAQKKLRFRRGSPGAKLLVQQMRDFGSPNCGKDGPDALEMAIRLALKLMGKR